ncbi:MAG: EAL domain-containing protein [Deltaproteobacteria bacterium]|nr:EAL domain-containing protein [Deltaproteobacteria bacterium]
MASANEIISAALEHEEFRVQYQPIVSLPTGRVAGFEALARWHRPGVGVVSPAHFIPMAEETGLIIPLGLWVLREACCLTRSWQERFGPTRAFTINVNFSAKQLEHPDLLQGVDDILLETGVEPGNLRIEITESVLMNDTEHTIATLRQLRSRNIGVYVDDFGTGYSSLSYLHRFPIDAVKIDRSFVSNIANSKTREIVRAVVALAGRLGMNCIVEGVETASQLAEIKELKCDYAQGYFFSRPVDPIEAEKLISKDFQRRKLSWSVPVGGWHLGVPRPAKGHSSEFSLPFAAA